jgi:hypothetical protein
MRHFVVAAFAWICIAAFGLAEASDIRSVKVRFKAGANSATIEESIRGRETVDYVLGAKAGQSMNVSMASDNDANYFNIIAPGETDAAFFNGSISGNQFEGTLPADGDYKIRVYLIRSAARRNETARYRLEMIIANAGSAGGSESSGGEKNDPWQRIGTDDFDATGQIPCAGAAGQPSRNCNFGVVRMGNGSALVKVMWPDGGNRVITFKAGKPTAYDASEADGGAKLSHEKSADLYIIRIGDQRFEIPEAVVYGG